LLLLINKMNANNSKAFTLHHHKKIQLWMKLETLNSLHFCISMHHVVAIEIMKGDNSNVLSYPCVSVLLQYLEYTYRVNV
jgi:hypothetical protein